MKDPLWYGEQDENGVDLSLIRANMELTPEERLQKGEQAARDAEQARAIATGKVGEIGLQVTDIDDLLSIKKEMNRLRQLESLHQLLAIKRIRDETGKR